MSRQGLSISMSFMTWIRLTTHWIVNNCDLGKVSVCIPSRDCVGLHIQVVGCVCAWNFEMKFFYGGGGGGECETSRKTSFSEKWKNGNFDQNLKFF